MIFLDVAGLSRNATPEYIAALNIEDCTPIAPEHRLTMLKRLQEGAGVHLVTGPEGASFWQPVSVEVHVDIRPDGYEYKTRHQPDLAWALQTWGVTALAAEKLAERAEQGKLPTGRAKVYPQFVGAQALLETFQEHTDYPGSIVVEAHHIEAVTDPAEQLALLDRVENVAMDWEWNIDPAVAPMFEPEGLSVATGDRTWYLPLICSDYLAPFGQGDLIRAAVQRTIMRTPTVWHNAKADLGTQWQGAPLDAFGSPLHDTLVMAFVAGEFDLALKPLARSMLGRDPLDFPGTMRNLPLETCRRYGGADSRNTYDLFRVLWQRLVERAQLDVYNDIERPIIPLLVDMERYGMPLDPERAMVLRDEMAEEEEAIRARFIAEDSLDVSKEKDTRELIKKRAGYDPGTLKKEAIAKIEGEWMDALLRYRQVRHRRRAFLVKHIEKWEAAGKPDEWRGYTSFTQAGSQDQHETRGFKHAPRSGRLSSSSPEFTPPGGIGAPLGNGQNQPSDIKEIFVAPKGTKLWARDYKQLEVRIAAARSKDTAMIGAAMSAEGLHVDFQNRILAMSGKHIAKVAAKQGNFNAAYGGYTDMLRTILQKQRVFLPDEDLQLICDTHKEAYPNYYRYGDSVIAWAHINGYSETAFGRRRYDPDVFSADTRTRLAAERALINHTIQGSGADMLKLAMKFAVPVLKYYGAHLASQVHDELVGWCNEDVIEPFLQDLDRAIAPIQILGTAVRFETDGGYGDTWKEAKP